MDNWNETVNNIKFKICLLQYNIKLNQTLFLDIVVNIITNIIKFTNHLLIFSKLSTFEI